MRPFLLVPLAVVAVSLTLSAKAQIKLNSVRHAAGDLEVAGNLPGVPEGATRYLAYEELRKLPQVTFNASLEDDNFKAGFARPAMVNGVRLEVLAHALGVNPSVQMPVAFCSDGYRANYPAEYMAAHHPVLVLAVNGLKPEQWPKSHYGDAMSPYLISHDNFQPAFKVLSHTDEPQIPYAVVRIEFQNQGAAFRAIAPPAKLRAEPQIAAGYRIAKQNCFRCHNNGVYGGQMARHPWQVLAAWAAYEPEYFRAYVRDPSSQRPEPRMPGNPAYNDQTIEALRRYFASFAQPGSTAQNGRSK